MPLFLDTAKEETRNVRPSQADPFIQLDQKLAFLEIQKKQHLEIPKYKGGKKMNRLSYIGLFFGFVIASAAFFSAGFILCYSLYPPYGGLIFSSQYDDVSSSAPLQASAFKENSDVVVPVQVPLHSYAERQALLAKANNQRLGTQGLLAQAEDRTLRNLKSQVRYAVVDKTRSWSQNWGGRFGNFFRQIFSPIIQDLPVQYSDQLVSNQLGMSHSEPKPFVADAQGGRDLSLHESLQSKGQQNKIQQNQNQENNQVFQTVATSSSEETKTTQALNLYGLRVQAFKDRDSALKLGEELKQRGFQSYIVPLWRGHHLEFQVRSGLYQDFSQAMTAANVLRAQGLELTNVVIAEVGEERLQP